MFCIFLAQRFGMDGVQKSEFLQECNSIEFTPDTRISYDSCQYFIKVLFLSQIKYISKNYIEDDHPIPKEEAIRTFLLLQISSEHSYCLISFQLQLMKSSKFLCN